MEQFQVELAHLEGKEQPQAQLLRTVAEVEGGLMIVSLWEGQAQYDSWAEATLLPQIDLPGGMEGRPEQRKGLVVDHYSVLPASRVVGDRVAGFMLIKPSASRAEVAQLGCLHLLVLIASARPKHGLPGAKRPHLPP